MRSRRWNAQDLLKACGQLCCRRVIVTVAVISVDLVQGRRSRESDLTSFDQRMKDADDTSCLPNPLYDKQDLPVASHAAPMLVDNYELIAASVDDADCVRQRADLTPIGWASRHASPATRAQTGHVKLGPHRKRVISVSTCTCPE
jgi:hypothetical protein